MSDQRGFVYVLSVLSLMAMTMWLSSGLKRGATEMRVATTSAVSQRAFHVAEAGVDQVMMNLRTITVADDLYTYTSPAGSFTIDQPITQLTPELYQASIQGTADGMMRSIEAVFEVSSISLFSFAMFGDEGIVVEGSTRIDSYDSRIGPYDILLNSNDNGNVGTNETAVGAITLNGSALFIDGQMSVGPNVPDPESVVVGLDPSLVSGDPPVVSSPEVPMPPVTIPEWLICDDLRMQGNQVRMLSAPGPYCFEDLLMRGSATLTSDGPVVIYIQNTLNIEGGATFGVVDDPSQTLLLMASGSSATVDGAIEGQAVLHTAMYAPDARVEMAGGATVYGSVVGNDVAMSGSARLHYDEALANIEVFPNLRNVRIRSWKDD